MRHHKLSDEEKIAKQLAKIVSDLTLDLEAVGVALAKAFPNVIYHRLEVIKEAAENEREMINVRNTHNPFF
jgi:hypothetical protein